MSLRYGGSLRRRRLADPDVCAAAVLPPFSEHALIGAGRAMLQGQGRSHVGLVLAEASRVPAKGAFVPPLGPGQEQPGTTVTLNWTRRRPRRLPHRDT